MTWKLYALLGCLGLAMALVVSSFQPFPGYMDADYYFAGGIQLAEGRGFSEPYIWNYLEEPNGLPHPSHSYWMPLASILSAFGMWLTGRNDYASGRMIFILLTAIVPVVTARLAFTLSGRAWPALIAGLLAVFSIYYAPFLPVTDNYAIYIVLGALFMLAVTRNGTFGNLSMGVIAGAMSLARSDGVLWLLLGFAASLAQGGLTPAAQNTEQNGRQANAQAVRPAWLRLCAVLAGFLLVMAPWLARNLEVYGAARAPGAERVLWLSTYDEIFVYPIDGLTLRAWWNQGVQALIAARLAAGRWNLLNALAAQGGVFLLPLILMGAWEYRRDLRVRLGVAGWLMLLAVMTLVLPAVGARGGWFHAGSGFQALWWSLAPLGLESLVTAARKRNLFTPHASVVFGVALVFVAAIMTAVILWLRVFPGWGEGEDRYPDVEMHLIADGASPDDVVMVRNPPGYYLMTGRSAIVVPYAGSAGMLLAAEKYGAEYLVIEEAGAAGPIRGVYDDLSSQRLEFLGAENGTRIFRVRP